MKPHQHEQKLNAKPIQIRKFIVQTLSGGKGIDKRIKEHFRFQILSFNFSHLRGETRNSSLQWNQNSGDDFHECYIFINQK